MWQDTKWGKGHVYLTSRAVSENHLGCDGSGDLSSNSDSVITLNLLLGKLHIPGFNFARSKKQST